MPSLDALDTAIAIVIVLLLLSLIVQSVQAMLKKLLKIKSRQLEQSLVDLFQHVLSSQRQDQKSNERATSRVAGSFLKSPMLQLLIPRKKHPSEQAGGDVEKLYKAVVIRFKEIGRVSAAGKHMLDSISKEDLLKVLRSVAPGALLPNLVAELTEAIKGINILSDAIDAIAINDLDGEASAKFAAMHEALAPVLSDMRSLMAGKELKPELLLGDVMNLRQIKLDEVLKLLGEVQKKVEQDIAQKDNPKEQALKNLAEGLKGIARAIIAVRQKFDSALAPLRIKLNEVEVWYDTVMQSFDERYARGMKTWAVVISFVVVVFLNANFFTIYRNISTSDMTRNLIVEAGPQILARSKAATNARPAQSPSPGLTSTPSPTPSPTPTPAPGSAILTTTTTTTPPSAVTITTTTERDDQTSEELLTSLKKIREQIKNDVDTYAGLGFTPLRWAQVRYWVSSLPPFQRDQPEGAWLINRKQDLKTLLGWIITALLLSVGAPFWQDALESLFGVKALLRKRGDIKNVETEAGAGNPKA